MENIDLATIPGLGDHELKTQTLPTGIHQRVEDGRPFVVLNGRAMVEFDERDALIFLRRGSMCKLTALAATRWTVSAPIEYLVVSEASIVFKEHDGERAGMQDRNLPHSPRPFRPRRHVS
jgi:hypothetical protein